LQRVGQHSLVERVQRLTIVGSTSLR
jgi:hypothetical protein